MQKIKIIVFTILILAFSISCMNSNKKEEKQQEKLTKWHAPKEAMPTEQCPCCDYITLAERGHYSICPICFWEDDGLDIDQLDRPSSPNHGITLREARANFAQFGACELIMVKHVISVEERKKFKRSIRTIGKE
jgi:hypothetical protein